MQACGHAQLSAFALCLLLQGALEEGQFVWMFNAVAVSGRGLYEMAQWFVVAGSGLENVCKCLWEGARVLKVYMHVSLCQCFGLCVCVLVGVWVGGCVVCVQFQVLALTQTSVVFQPAHPEPLHLWQWCLGSQRRMSFPMFVLFSHYNILFLLKDC